MSLSFCGVRIVQAHAQKIDETRTRMTEEQRTERNAQLARTMALLVHASGCADPECPSSNCSKVKGLFHHAVSCPQKVAGGCQLCRCAHTPPSLSIAIAVSAPSTSGALPGSAFHLVQNPGSYRAACHTNNKRCAQASPYHPLSGLYCTIRGCCLSTRRESRVCR